MHADVVILDPSDARSAPRTNMFIAAVLNAAGGAAPVRLRNMSPSGALAEGNVLPAAGSAVQLIRGALRVAGEVAWIEGNRCGLRFASAVVVRDWMSATAHAGQGRVDAMVRQLQSGGAVASPAPDSSMIGEADFARLQRLLDRLGEDLCSDAASVARHAASLQNLDIAGQLVGALAGAADPDPAIRAAARARIESLRASADQALGRSLSAA